ncbi:phosphotransferase [Tundrisphaera sp. TA3]|uniref:phosphotransferase n=1 Tax=Tundrisphaera sp. TA3 TaxID=3435775 RepID=UPI003EBD8310
MPNDLGREEDAHLRRLLALVPSLPDRRWAIRPLGGGMTNHNYRVDAGGESYALRIAGADTAALGIDRDQEVACLRAAAAGGVGPEVIAYLPEHEAILTRHLAGRTLGADDLRDPGILGRVAGAIRRGHDLPVPAGVTRFSVFATIRHNRELAEEAGVAMPAELDRPAGVLDRLEAELGTGEPPCLCHNDLLPANLIDDGRRAWIIDWEYAGQGDRFFDLGCFAANGDLDEAQERTLAEVYFGEVRPADLRRIRLMRLASCLREATWGYLQSAISQVHGPEFYLDYAEDHLGRFVAARGPLL